MLDISEIKVGMMVKIVDEWGMYCGNVPLMDRYLGRVVEVKKIVGESFCIVEDSGDPPFIDGVGWYFNGHCIDYIVGDDISSVSEDDILQLL